MHDNVEEREAAIHPGEKFILVVGFLARGRESCSFYSANNALEALLL